MLFSLFWISHCTASLPLIGYVIGSYERSPATICKPKMQPAIARPPTWAGCILCRSVSQLLLSWVKKMQPLNATSRYRQSKHGVVFWLMPSSVAFMLPWRSRKRLLRPRLLGDSYLGWPACRPDHLCVLHMYTSSVLKKGACFWNENSKNGPNFLKNRRWQKCLHFSKNNFKNIIFYGSRQLTKCVALPEKNEQVLRI